MQSTISEDPAEIFETLAGTLGAELEAARGLNGYAQSQKIKREGETLARVLYGGGNGSPHVIVTGAASDDVVPVLRTAWPDHEVSRMDTAQDFSQEGGYDRVAAVMENLADASRLTVTRLESVKNGVRSRTLYLGAPSSRIRVRLYEKGCFEQQLGNESDSDWFRLEAQIRPTGKDARQVAAYVGADEAWGMSRWTRQLASETMGLEVEPITMRIKREPDYMRAIRSLARQYGATLSRAMDVEGSWDGVRELLKAEGAEL